MGIISVQHGKRKYTIELESHDQDQSELPVENLHAIFFEGGSRQPKNADEMLDKLKSKGKYLGEKYAELIERAKNNGTEVWFGDAINPGRLILGGASILTSVVAGTKIGQKAATLTRRKFLNYTGHAMMAALLGDLLSMEPLTNKGDVSNRRFSLSNAKHMGSILGTDMRNALMAHNIKKLAKISGHINIGVSTGSLHAGIADLVAQGREITKDEKQKINNSYPVGKTMYRCTYDKQASRWKVEEHSL